MTTTIIIIIIIIIIITVTITKDILSRHPLHVHKSNGSLARILQQQ